MELEFYAQLYEEGSPRTVKLNLKFTRSTKSETYTVTAEDEKRFGVKVNPEYHGTSGPIHRTMPKWTTNTHDTFIEALNVLGVPYNPDPVRSLLPSGKL